MAGRSARAPQMRQLVRVSTPALREMVLATVESYQLKKDRKRQGVEVYGHIWGHQRQTDDLLVYSVESVSISTTSIGEHDSVEPNPESLALKQAVMERWYPQLTLLGDFHSHPYKNLPEVREVAGFEFSTADIRSFRKDDTIWKAAGDRPLMLVMTICKLDRVRESQESYVRDNIQCFTIGEFRFWLNGCAGYLADDPKRRKPVRMATPDRGSTLLMDVFPTAYNASRDRLLRENLANE